MKILAFTDLHGHIRLLKGMRKKAANADIIVCAGDFTVFQTNMKKVLEEINRLGKEAGKKVLLINGNHEDERAVEKLCSRLESIVFIHKKIYSCNSGKKSFLFAGYGGMGFSMRDKGFERFAKGLAGLAKKRNLILVTHAPPYGCRLDNLWARDCGNMSITAFIMKEKPLLSISGHFHEHFGDEDKIGRTKVVNPGPEGRIIELR